VLFQQRTDSTERGILVKAVRRVRVLDATPEHHLAPRRCGPNKRTLRREGKLSGSEGLLKMNFCNTRSRDRRKRWIESAHSRPTCENYCDSPCAASSSMRLARVGLKIPHEQNRVM
jgi:hypothetical protein